MSNIARLAPQASDMLPEQGGGGGGQDSGSIVNVREIIGILRRHYIMIAAIAIVGTALTALWVNQLTPLYQAEAQVLVDPSREVINPKFQAVNPGIAQSYAMMETQIAIMHSRDLAVQAVRRLDLVNHPLYNPALARPQPSTLSSILAPITALFGDPQPQQPKVPVNIAPQSAEERQRLQDGIVNAYLGSLRIIQAGTSQVIQVRFVSPDPVLAAKAANVAAQVYLEDQISNRGESTQSALKFLSEKVEELRLKMIAAEQELTVYRTKNGMLQSGDQSPVIQQLASYRQQLVEVRGLIRNFETSLEQVKAVQRAQGSIDSVGAVMTNTFIAQLRSQAVDLERKLADVRTQLRDNHPQVLALRNELAQIQGKIGTEIGKVATNIANDLALARQREASLNAEIQRLTGDQASLQTGEAELRALQLNSQTSRQVYEATLARFNEVSVTDDKVQKADARIINGATVPGGPFAPRKDLYIMMALLISLAVGVGLAVLIELLDSGFRSVNQLEQMANAPALGMVPYQAGKAGRNKRPWDTVLDKPNSSFAEAIRTIRTGLLLSSVDHPPRSVLVTSSVPGEGKTTTALALASAAAASGLRTVIVDCDMRQPSMHVNLGANNELGLSDYLTGNAQLEDLIHIDDRSGLHYICAGRLPPSPTDLLSSSRMKQLLQQLAAAFQMVMLDTPPILAVSDALLLVRSVDKTIFAVRWEKTRRDVALNGLKAVFDAGARVGGLVLTQVNLRKHAQYDYSDSGVYYYRGYKRYYVD